MKKILYLFSMVMCFCMVACSDNDGDGDKSTIPSQSVTIPANATNLVVTLEGLDSPIESAIPQDTWLSVNVMPYESGAVTVKISATNNSNADKRITKVAILTTTGKRMELNVTQKGQSSDSSDDSTIEELHDDVTDQPAYAPVRKTMYP